MEQLQLEAVVREIDTAFGAEVPFTDRPLTELETEVLAGVFGDEGFQRYTQDLANRQIIRDYLTNAVMLGFIPQPEMSDLQELIGTHEARASLSLHMLMSSVEQAAELLSGGAPARLKLLEPDSNSPPHMHLISS